MKDVLPNNDILVRNDSTSWDDSYKIKNLKRGLFLSFERKREKGEEAFIEL